MSVARANNVKLEKIYAGFSHYLLGRVMSFIDNYTVRKDAEVDEHKKRKIRGL